MMSLMRSSVQQFLSHKSISGGGAVARSLRALPERGGPPVRRRVRRLPLQVLLLWWGACATWKGVCVSDWGIRGDASPTWRRMRRRAGRAVVVVVIVAAIVIVSSSNSTSAVYVARVRPRGSCCCRRDAVHVAQVRGSRRISLARRRHPGSGCRPPLLSRVSHGSPRAEV